MYNFEPLFNDMVDLLWERYQEKPYATTFSRRNGFEIEWESGLTNYRLSLYPLFISNMIIIEFESDKKEYYTVYTVEEAERLMFRLMNGVKPYRKY